MKTIVALALVSLLVGGAVLAPTAAADITFSFDWNGDRDCNDPGETISIPSGPVHRHGLCNVLA